MTNAPITSGGFKLVVHRYEVNGDIDLVIQNAEDLWSGAVYSRYHNVLSDTGWWGDWQCTSGVDSVVAEGISDFWTYRKWASGIAECWGGKRVTLTQTGNYWFGEIALPFTFYKTANSIDSFAVIQSGGGYTTNSLYPASCYSDSTVTSVNTAAINVTATGAVDLIWHVIGRWK